ncbi:MAG: hypothetical protein K2N05_04860 [Muribaculaceae bacterium]|nr:hypothetical protein [Muribaculaceae bacterium]
MNDCFEPDSIEFQQKDLILNLAEKYNPAIIPLVEILYRINDTHLSNHYLAVSKNIINGEYQPLLYASHLIYFYLLDQLMVENQYEEALALFSDSLLFVLKYDFVEFNLILFNAAILKGDKEKMRRYLKAAIEGESCYYLYTHPLKYNEISERQYEEFMRNSHDYVIAHPEEMDFVDLYMRASMCPIEVCYDLAISLLKGCSPIVAGNRNWNWRDVSDFTDDQLKSIKAGIEICYMALRSEKRDTDGFNTDYLLLLLAIQQTIYPDQQEYALCLLDEISKRIGDNDYTEYNDLRVMFIVARAYIAAHGMDRPEEALIILNSEIKSEDTLSVSPQTGLLFWHYLREVSESCGKKKEVKKCEVYIDYLRKLIDSD